MNKFLGHLAVHGTFQNLIDGQAIPINGESDDCPILCPVCRDYFRRRCLMRAVEVSVMAVGEGRQLGTTTKLFVCTSMAAQVAQDCGFVAPYSWWGPSLIALASERIAYLRQQLGREQRTGD